MLHDHTGDGTKCFQLIYFDLRPNKHNYVADMLLA